MREKYLEQMAKRHGWKVGAEIGLWYGRTFFHLLDTVPGLVLYGVDDWRPVKELTHHKDQERNRMDVWERAKNYKGRAIILEMPSLVAAQVVGDDTLDFVFIDADHSREAVLGDIGVWVPKIKPGGFATGHDWDWASVRSAVIASLPDATPGTGGNDWVWSWRKP